ncbi:DUF420 domain-containing protein [Telmatospirillum sp. J64-1]|uniref:DUF420 domain-containing protein n=1 Tax=Telmatospirillum sp. J64-1 TaxID=2502183 RepID=UPI00115E2961|nr:DUF420 domain-containing protein [Telmatospirillum sp. J64-1]
MNTATVLPHVTAALNAVSLLLLLVGFVLIRQRRQAAHRAAMMGAMGASAAFLAVYVVYHFTAPIFVFTGEGMIRPVYYFILITHVILAAVVFPMILMTAARALRGRFEGHRGLARWTYPIWLYVSVTGLVVYAMLYHIYYPVA